MSDSSCTLLINYESSEPINVSALRNRLENGNTEEKIAAMKHMILLMLNGEAMSHLLMTVIRFIMPCKDHTLKKLVLLYWEVVDKRDSSGKLLHEMILVCNALLNDLKHPNEYVRGATLRFICKLKESELLEPLVPSIRANLEHRHSYVKRNAVLAIYSIFKHFDYLIPDAPDLIFNLLANEGDASCQRNAFIMLFNCAQDRAVEYLSSVLDKVEGFGDILQFTVVELIRKVCRTNPEERPKYLRCLFTLLNSPAAAVRFEAAGTLISLTTAPTAVSAAASTFIKLLVSQSDNNVKMIVLDRLQEVKQRHLKVMQDLVMDLLRALVCPDMDVRQKTLAIAMDLVTPQNIDEVVLFLKKEINLSQAKTFDRAEEYRQLLIQSIHSCAVMFPVVAKNVVLALLDYLGDEHLPSALDVVNFVKEVMETYPQLREMILGKLLPCLRHVRFGRVLSALLWVIGEFSTTSEQIDQAFTAIKEEVGPLPFDPSASASQKNGENSDSQPEQVSASGIEPEAGEIPKAYTPTNAVGMVLSDGTYATQSAITAAAPPQRAKGNKGLLRQLLLEGKFFLASALATALTKMAYRCFTLSDISASSRNSFVAEVCLILVSILKLGKILLSSSSVSSAFASSSSSFGSSSRSKTFSSDKSQDPDSLSRVSLCLNLLLARSKGEQRVAFAERVFLSDCRKAFHNMLNESKEKEKQQREMKERERHIEADDLISMRQLAKKRAFGEMLSEDVDEADLRKATGFSDIQMDMSQRLCKLHQLSGLSDPVFVEAYINVNMYDLLIDMVIINQTQDTLQNLNVEVATTGDLRVCERPQSCNLGPFASINMKINIKVSSTEKGIVFTNVVYDVAGVAADADKNCVILKDIHLNIMDYIKPASCSHLEFRSMWAEFEWENKVAVNTTIK
ncbi:Coatomer subunit beta [Balamuthia mandrillaris]